MRWAYPGWLILLVLVPLPWLLSRARPRLAWPTLAGFGRQGTWWARFKGSLPILARCSAIACMVAAMARPQTVGGRLRIAGQGVAIVVAMDQSSSMNTPDFPDGPGRPAITRLDAAKRTVANFIGGRPDDLVGLVVFANYPDFAGQLTLSHSFLIDTVESIRSASPGDDGTNLGDAIVWAIEGLKDATPKKKVLVLLTDGRNAPAVPKPIDPIQAARIAKGLGITLHTIAAGKAGVVTLPIDPVTKLGPTVEVEGPDHDLLAKLAEEGGGRAFSAADAGSLEEVFHTIDQLEKSQVRGEIHTRYREDFAIWAIAALGLIFADRLLAVGWLRRIP